VKLADFGLAKNVGRGTIQTMRHGLEVYCAPEVLRNTTSTASDVWSFGVVVLEILTNCFSGINAILPPQPFGQPMTDPQQFANAAIRLATQMRVDPRASNLPNAVCR